MLIKISPVNVALEFQTPVMADIASVSEVTVNMGMVEGERTASAKIQLGHMVDAPPPLGESGDTVSVFDPLRKGHYTVSMTPQQYQQWGQDDAAAALVFVEAMGLTPVDE